MTALWLEGRPPTYESSPEAGAFRRAELAAEMADATHSPHWRVGHAEVLRARAERARRKAADHRLAASRLSKEADKLCREADRIEQGEPK